MTNTEKILIDALKRIRSLEPHNMAQDYWSTEMGLVPDDVFDIVDEALKAVGQLNESLFDKPEDRYEPEDKAEFVSATSRSKAIADKLGKPYNDTIGSEPDDEVDESMDTAHELKVGIANEMEHTDDPKVAQQIATDHLKENPHYYSDLMKCGLVDEPDALKAAKTEVALADTGVYDDLTKSGLMNTTPPTHQNYVGAFAEDCNPQVGFARIVQIDATDPQEYKKLASSGLGSHGAPLPLTPSHLDTGENFAEQKPTPAKAPAPAGSVGPNSVSISKTKPVAGGVDAVDHFCKAISVTLRPLSEGVERSIRQGITPVMGSRRWSIPYGAIPPAEPLTELAFENNAGVMEIAKFYNVATPEQMAEFDRLVAANKDKFAWLLVQAVTGVRLQGRDEEFGTETELDFYKSAKGL